MSSSAATAQPLISVVFPVKNESGAIRACLEGIFSQTLADEVEIIAVDSGSTDGTLDILRQYPVSVHEIPSAEFNHGETRNVGVRLARGKFVVLTVADARAADERWLERMFRHFDDPHVAGVCGQQIVPHEPDKNPLQWFRPYSEPKLEIISFSDPKEFEALPAREKLRLCGWDDVSAMYRRSALLKVPFRSVNFAEDMAWAHDALLTGFAIVYDYSARVYHYHEETFSFRFRRTYTIHFHAHELFGVVPPTGPLIKKLSGDVYRSLRPKYCATRHWHWMSYNLRLTFSESLAALAFWLVSKLGRSRLGSTLNNWFGSTVPQASRSTPAQTASAIP